MKEIRLHEGELNVMELLWSNKELAAKDISKIIKEYIGWEKNTTYTVIKRLILCRANITKHKVQEIETKILFDKFYGGSLTNFIDSYIGTRTLTPDNIAALKRITSRL